jgi:ubiquinone/menaquinone biosynthesis C-methylase UbiE
MATLLNLVSDHASRHDLWDVPYLPNRTLREYLLDCRERRKRLYQCLNLPGLLSDDWRRFIARLDNGPGHFESDAAGGRGDSYRRAQKRQPLIRARGIQELFRLLKPPDGVFTRREIVLDILGGNGTLTRAMRRLQPTETLPLLITSDASPAMIADALSQNLPAIRQPAEMLLLADCSVDGVIFAYGTHHIPPAERPRAVREAFRVLKPGGRVVVQDFEEGTPTARWYSELLDRYTLTGHKCQHFTRTGLGALIEEAGFERPTITDAYDPFVVAAVDPEEAQRELVEHVCALFGLKKLFVPPDLNGGEQWRNALETLRPYGMFEAERMPKGADAVTEFTVKRVDYKYVAEFPRIALVAAASKPRTKPPHRRGSRAHAAETDR